MREHCRSPAVWLAFAALAVGCAAGPPARVHPYPRVTPERAHRLIAVLGPRLVILDVRTPEEFATGHVPGAFNVDVSRPDFQACLVDLDWRLSYLVMCQTGRRSTQAAVTMVEMQFEHVFELEGGCAAWLAEGYAVVTGPEPAGVPAELNR